MASSSYCIERYMLIRNTGDLIVNEIAPRPHNSGHYTIEACPTMSQYKAQLLSILGIMPDFSGHIIPIIAPATLMLNILGGASKTSHDDLVKRAMCMPNAALHMYGKESKPGRKIGHITLLASSMAVAEADAATLIDIADTTRTERKSQQTTSSIALAPTVSSTLSSSPQIVVTMGSDSDLPVLKPGLALLESLAIPFDVTITSAHRTPHAMTRLAETAAARGYKVIIAAAGGAAHLPGMLAASTPLPVIGVPVKASTQDGMDSLLSIVQMPRGVPVATVAINNSTNAALLAARILGTSDEVIFKKLEVYMKNMKDEVDAKARMLETVGWEGYKGL